MAEDSNAGVRVVVIEVDIARGIRSAGINIACPIVCCCCCSEEFLFLCLQVLAQGTASCVVSCKALPGHSVDIDSLHVSHGDVSLYLRWGRPMAILPNASQITVNDVFVDATTLHTYSGHDTTIAVCIV